MTILKSCRSSESPPVFIPPTNLSKKRIAFVGILGTVFEYFDYSLYGFMAPSIARYFFSADPSGDTTLAMVQAFGLFAVGSCAKPLGSLIFGRIGDFSGRRPALQYSFLGIAIPTIIVGSLPGYETLGVGCAFALILCRLTQGIFVSGESDGVRIYLQEHFPQKHSAFVSNLSYAGAYLGITFASIAAGFFAETTYWRLPFFISALGSLLVFALRRSMKETAAFEVVQSQKAFVSGKDAYIPQWRGIARTILVCGAGGGLYHLYLVFWGSFQSKVLTVISASDAKSQTTAMALIYTVSLPIFGWLADRFGLYRTISWGVKASIGFLALHFFFPPSERTPLLLLLLTTLSICMMTAAAFVLLTRQFQTAVRFRCLSIGHSIGSMLFSGSTPALNMFLWSQFQWGYTPLIYQALLLAMFWLGIRKLKDQTEPPHDMPPSMVKQAPVT